MDIFLPTLTGELRPYGLQGKPLPKNTGKLFTSRIAYAAAHVVVDPLRTVDIASPVVDWEKTLAFRRHLWSLGFSVAEAMDTAQRGMGLDWKLALELIQRSAREAAACGGGIASGAGTDHLALQEVTTLDQVVEAYLLQCEAVEAAGSRIILMASRALARIARSPDDYRTVYEQVLRQVKQPVILHWLGPMFDPALTGYWGTTDIPSSLDHCLDLIAANAAKIEGIKVSLLDAGLEIAMRRRLPTGVRMYTGDDFNYDTLIQGDEYGHSDALLGIFDAIAPAASLALQALDAGDFATYSELLAPTVPLSREIFRAPTYLYKTGIVFLAYLNGFQNHFRMVGGSESARGVLHMVRLFELADQARLLRNPDIAIARMRRFLEQSLG